MIERLRENEKLRGLYRKVVRHPAFAPKWYELALLAPLGKLDKMLYERGILSVERLTLPDFLGIGTQKSATTWLWDNLYVHPEVFLPRIKELHFFHWNFHWSVRHYARYFRAGRGKVKGEITPNYCAMPVERIRFLRKIMPNVRLILLLRNPIDRAWSAATMFLCRSAKRRYEDVSEEEFLREFQSERSISLGDYITMIDNWLSIFPEEQLYIGFYEDVKHCPERLLTEVFVHIGVSPKVDWSKFPLRVVYNPGKGIPMPDKYRLFLQELYRERIEAMYARFGERVAAWMDFIPSGKSIIVKLWLYLLFSAGVLADMLSDFI